MFTLTFLLLTFITFANALPFRKVHSMRFPKSWKRQTPSSVGDSQSTPSSTVMSSPSSVPTCKYVVAHHMVGNTYPYTITDWANDIALAHSYGIDGFALNVGVDSWQPQRVADAYVLYRIYIEMYLSNILVTPPRSNLEPTLNYFCPLTCRASLSLRLPISLIIHCQVPSWQHPG
jgi:hypothetical protein